MKIYSFPRGGLVYEDPTAPQKDNAENAFLPAVSVIPLGDSTAKVYPVVQLGEMVREGMLIGRASGPNAVNVHATVPGRIIRKVSWKDKNGVNNDGIVIRMEGAFEKLGRKEDSYQWKALSGYDCKR